MQGFAKLFVLKIVSSKYRIGTKDHCSGLIKYRYGKSENMVNALASMMKKDFSTVLQRKKLKNL